ncbi:Mu-like prophage major head subunit gpT family protein [Sphaerotilus sp.]|uniref:Mu-like prophage major head subunit gpT family protein n=1 Tax=Sphaerotilus sp. TaxID=2093942 RepID=UPI00286DDB74|nr:Mu-like prophage major head subunit gpT family protein [Sphaerotilus sp.]
MDINAGNLSILSQAIDMRFNRGMQRATTPWNAVAMEIPSTSGESLYPYFKDLGYIREWVGERVIQNVSQDKFVIRNKPFEESHGIDREAIEDDSYGIYANIFEQTGQNAANFPGDLVYSTLKSGLTMLGPDGQYFFDTDHPVRSAVVSNHMGGTGEAWFIVDSSMVMKPLIWQPRKKFNLVKLFNENDANVFFQKKYIWGVDGRGAAGFSPWWQLAFASKQALDIASLKATLTAMSSQIGESGKPLKVKGTHLIVSPAQAEVAYDLLNKDTLAGGETNTMKKRLELVVAPELLV